ncbi:MAG: 23S rRNA (guanosine(2251)-2'-O)-methyltransferase RlmB [Candidatus Gastranaerophilales bacterium]|nr:23S rRNA (guanosine(2251)-2'-O)-methyltransferase RlmB [Candidatus Gastranaerophilales bacterium]
MNKTGSMKLKHNSNSQTETKVFSTDNIVYGKNSVIEALSSDREINKIIISGTNHSDAKIEQIKSLARKLGVVFQFAGKDKFAPYSGLNHQGVIAFVSPIKYVELDDFMNSHKSVVSSMVILDGVEDSHNTGAIIRTCVCAGIDGILIPSRRNCLITPIVEKTSAGAVNHIDIIKVNSLSGAVQKLKDNNWWVIATDAKSEKNYYDIDYCDMNFAIIMGGEHTGVSKTLLKMSDFQVKIPMLKDFNSLNVSNAMSIIIYESVRQKLSKNEDK